MIAFIASCQCIYYVSKARQRIVDLFCLFEGFSLGARFTNFLTTCKVNKPQLGRVLLLLQVDAQDSMAPRTFFVEFGRGNFSAFGCFLDQVHHFLLALNIDLLEAFNINFSILMFLQLEIGAITKHVDKLLFVKFHHGAFNLGIYPKRVSELEYFSDASVDKSIFIGGLLAEDSIGLS